MTRLFATLSALVLATSPIHSQESADATDAQVVALVEKTAAEVAANAPDVFKKICAGEAPYKNQANPEFYVFVYDPDVNMIAHPNKDLVGKNFKGKPDVKGKKFRDMIVEVALTKDNGWVEYAYQKPGEKGIFEKKSYCKLVSGSDGKKYIVVSGKYVNKK